VKVNYKIMKYVLRTTNNQKYIADICKQKFSMFVLKPLEVLKIVFLMKLSNKRHAVEKIRDEAVVYISNISPTFCILGLSI
jgi:hypothetical protein